MRKKLPPLPKCGLADPPVIVVADAARAQRFPVTHKAEDMLRPKPKPKVKP